MSRNKRRADRIRKEIPIAQLLYDLGYSVRPDADYREQQFSCDMHGDGQDHKPSARVYPDSNSWYCFACPKIRDGIQTVQEKHGLGFLEALKWLEDKYDLEPLPFENNVQAPSFQQEIASELDPVKSFEQYHNQIKTLLDNITESKLFGLDMTVAFWEALDKLTYMFNKGLVTEDTAKKTLMGIHKRIMIKWRETVSDNG
mgnify:CR=1 FL=1